MILSRNADRRGSRVLQRQLEQPTRPGQSGLTLHQVFFAVARICAREEIDASIELVNSVIEINTLRSIAILLKLCVILVSYVKTICYISTSVILLFKIPRSFSPIVALISVSSVLFTCKEVI